MTAETNTYREIRSVKRLDGCVGLPPSKSYTNRAFIAAALATGESSIMNASESDDSRILLAALRQFGISIKENGNSIDIEGSSGKFTPPPGDIFVGNAGTAMRFLTSFACLAGGATTITGDAQMNRRPVHDLLESLQEAGIKSESRNGYPPVTVHGGNLVGGRITMNGSVSSQFLSSMLLAAPYAKRPVILQVKGNLRSRPYIDMTLHVMRSFGGDVEAVDAAVYTVSNRDRYIGRDFTIEGDATSATYFAAAAAITRGRVLISDFSRDSLQGDARFLSILSEMGCSVKEDNRGAEVRGGQLCGIEIDMNDLPDCVPTLAVVAAFAEGPTTIKNIGHLRFKETDRLQALSTELRNIGAKVELFEDGLSIRPGPLHGGTIATYNDHRIAMSFAVAGLAIPQLRVMNPECVAKSFPNFWTEFSKLERSE